MSETDIKRAIHKGLAAAGFWVVRTATTGRRSSRSINNLEPGFPDLLLVGLGHIEVKRPGEELSPEQVEWHEKAKKKGVRVAAVDSLSDAMDHALGWRWEAEELDRLAKEGLAAREARKAVAI